MRSEHRLVHFQTQSEMKTSHSCHTLFVFINCQSLRELKSDSMHSFFITFSFIFITQEFNFLPLLNYETGNDVVFINHSRKEKAIPRAYMIFNEL